MSDPQPIMVDSNVPMYAAGADHPYREPCQRVLRQILSGEVDAMTSTEVHQEILHRYVSIGQATKARQVSEDFQAVVAKVVPVTIVQIDQARRLIATYPGLPVRDLIHVAVMLDHGITAIISADRHFDQVPEILRLDPTNLGSR